MRQELVTEEELMGQLREQGLDDPKKVKEAYLESNGKFSVVQYEEKQHPNAGTKGGITHRGEANEFLRRVGE